jgi:pSer/pThr/pTyr-binding forkhead associated (FHA) protein
MVQKFMIRCSTCLSQSSDGSISCDRCGFFLDKPSKISTRTMGPQIGEPEQVRSKHIVHIGKLPERGAALYIAQSDEPLIVSFQDKVTLGRRKDLQIPDLVDLTAYDAYRMGVSRTHAALVYRGDQIFVHDIGSVNGTWVDGQRLKPYELYHVPVGAAIALGQLMIYVYY